MSMDFSQISDEELASHVKNSDGFAELESRYLWLIGSIARRVKKSSSLDDDDLRQVGLLGLYDAALSYKKTEKASFKTYAATCISNRLKNEVRNHSSKKNSPLNDSVSLDEVSFSEVNTASSPELVLENQETFEAVLNQIHITLSDFERKVLALYLSGYKRSEISDAMGISVKAFDNAIQRVRKKLKAHSIGKVG